MLLIIGPTNADAGNDIVTDFSDCDDIPAAFSHLTAKLSKLLKKLTFMPLGEPLFNIKMFLKAYSFLMICITKSKQPKTSIPY